MTCYDGSGKFTSAHLAIAGERRDGAFGGLGARFMIEGAQTGAAFALVEHPIEPRVLAAPMHTPRHEDEYTHVLEGEVGVQVGDEVHIASPGDLVFKPRGVLHAFWNAGDAPARALGVTNQVLR